MSLTPELYELILKIIDERVKEIKVTREDFDRLTKQVAKLEEAIARLAEAQARTEERVTKLEEAVARLEEAVAKLAEAQLRTEERLTKLEEAQLRTEKALSVLIESMSMLETEVEGLKETVGFSLEDIAKVVLPGWIERHLRIKVEEMERKFFEIDKEEVEVDLYSEGRLKGERIAVLVEVKSRIGKEDVETFEKKFNKVKDHLKMKCVGILFGYLIYPAAQIEADKRKFYTVASYQR